MTESLYCSGQIVLSNQGKDNMDKIQWDNKNKRKVTICYPYKYRSKGLVKILKEN